MEKSNLMTHFQIKNGVKFIILLLVKWNCLNF